jgi:hypothetical protein
MAALFFRSTARVGAPRIHAGEERFSAPQRSGQLYLAL